MDRLDGDLSGGGVEFGGTSCRMEGDGGAREKSKDWECLASEEDEDRNGFHNVRRMHRR